MAPFRGGACSQLWNSFTVKEAVAEGCNPTTRYGQLLDHSSSVYSVISQADFMTFCTPTRIPFSLIYLIN